MFTVIFTVGTETNVEIKATEEGKVLLAIDGEPFAFSADDAKRFALNFLMMANAAKQAIAQTFVVADAIKGPTRVSRDELRQLGDRAANEGDTSTVADVTAALHGNQAALERCTAKLRKEVTG